MQRSAIVALVVVAAGALGHAEQTKSESSSEEDKKPAATVVEVDSGKVSLSDVEGPVVTIPLTVENVAIPARPLKALSIGLSSFTAPTESEVTATIAPARVDELAPGRRARFTVTATFVPAGTFTAQARVLEGQTPIASFTIAVVRKKGKPAIDVGDVAAVQYTTWPPHTVLDIPLTIRVYATSVSAVVPPPILHSALRKPKVDSTTAAATPATLDASEFGESLTITTDKPQDVTVTLKGIHAPGRYDAKLRFTTAGYEPIDKDVTVYVRDAWWVAFLVIFAGVLASLVFQAYGGSIRPRLVLQRRFERVVASLRNLQAAAHDDAKQLVAKVTAAINQQWKAAGGIGQTLSLKVDAYEQIVPALQLWNDMRKSVANVRPEAVRTKLVRELNTLADPFLAVAPDTTKIGEAVDKLTAFQRTIDKEVGDALASQANKLAHELQANGSHEAGRIYDSLQRIHDDLDRGDINAAAKAFDAVALAYATFLVEDLTTRIESGGLPVGMTDEEWRDEVVARTKQRIDEVKAQKEPEQAMRGATNAVKQHLFSVVSALRRAVEKLKDPAEIIVTAVAAAEQALADNKLGAAWNAVDNATRLYREPPVRVGKPLGGESALNIVDVVTGTGVGGSAFDLIAFFGGSGTATLGAAPRSASALRGFDWAASALALLIAALIGLQSLWIDNPVWGGWASYLAAFAWGFAVDQFTHAGISGLRSR